MSFFSRIREDFRVKIIRWKKLFAPIAYEKKAYFSYMFLRTFMASEGIITTWIVAKVVDYISERNMTGIAFVICFFGILKILTKVLQYKSNYLNNTIDFGINKKLAVHYLKKYITLDANITEMIGTGRIINIFSSGMGSWIDLLEDFIEIVGKVGAIVIGWILVFSSLIWWQSLVFFVCFILAVWSIQKGMNALNDIRKSSREIGVEISRQEAKIFMSKNEILQNHKIHQETESIANLHTKQQSLWVDNIWQKLRREILGNSIIEGAMFGFMIISVGLALAGHYQLSVFIIVINLLGRMVFQVWDIRNIMRSYFGMMIKIEKLWEVFDETPVIHGLDSGKTFVYSTGEIIIKKLSFGYHQEKSSGLPVFHDFSLTLTGGKKTALVGPSGSGKTTLIKLMSGVLRAKSGELAIDGFLLPTDQNIGHDFNGEKHVEMVSLQSYYAHIGYLTQDPSVFDGTIYENLVYGMKEATPNIPEGDLLSTIKEVISLAKCEFIWEFEKGLETEIGERGVRLSGGQKQRLAIAKIMLKNPNIIFLDEPTSAMDSFNEEEVTQALHNLFEGRTVVVVAHRLQTVKQADIIYYLEAGEHGSYLAEQGTHEELVKKKGKYKKMLDLQSGF